MQGLIHFNPSRLCQCDHAQAFIASGFAATTNVNTEAGLHVVSGPHYALSQWKYHPRVLMIDRAYWGDSEGYVSIGWLNSDGSRRFARGTRPRPKPDLEPWNTRDASCLILADYGENVDYKVSQAQSRFATVQVRRHPAEATEPQVGLEHAIRLRDVIIGGKGTAVFEAIIQGKPVICRPDNVCSEVCTTDITAPLYRGDREQWLHDMSYKQWSLDEIASGEAWEHLKDVQ